MATVYAEIGKTEYSGKHLTEITGTEVSLVHDIGMMTVWRLTNRQ